MAVLPKQADALTSELTNSPATLSNGPYFYLGGLYSPAGSVGPLKLKLPPGQQQLLRQAIKAIVKAIRSLARFLRCPLAIGPGGGFD